MSEETIPQMRDRIARLEKSEKDLKSQNEGLSKENTQLKARDQFREAGYPASYGDLFAGQAEPDTEITPEAVQDFVKAFNLNVDGSASEDDSGTTDEGGSNDDAGTDTEGLDVMARSGSRSGDGGSGSPEAKVLTRAEYLDLARNDPAAAKAAVANGRVQVSTDNPYVPSKGRVSGVNPYAPTPE